MFFRPYYSFNSLYGIHNLEYPNEETEKFLLSIPFMGYITYGSRKNKKKINLSIPFMGYIEGLLEMADTMSDFQFPLWDTQYTSIEEAIKQRLLSIPFMGYRN